MRSTTGNDSKPPWIYVSYHRDGYAAWAAGKIAQGLDPLLGPGSAFVDEYGMVGTEIWKRSVEAALGQSAVVLAVVTESWHAGWSEDGADWVRKEIRFGLERGLLVIPVCVDEAQAPRAAGIPTEVAALEAAEAFRVETRSTDTLDGTLRGLAKEITSKTACEIQVRRPPPLAHRKILRNDLHVFVDDAKVATMSGLERATTFVAPTGIHSLSAEWDEAMGRVEKRGFDSPPYSSSGKTASQTVPLRPGSYLYELTLNRDSMSIWRILGDVGRQTDSTPRVLTEISFTPAAVLAGR